jgi:hypothetical protein
MNLQYQTNCQKNITKILTSFEQKAFVEVSGKFNNQIFSTKEKFYYLIITIRAKAVLSSLQ